LRKLRLATALLPARGKIVAKLRRVDDALAPIAKRGGELLFAAAVAIRVGGVVEGNAQVSPHQPVDVVQRPKPTSLTVTSLLG
jgi:hypothetical protein